ncbi:MAG: PH domain-containing protein, partial [Planctomycetales bacterium]|nr:PH domain-containing protein [Planctomycetales bacterium]
VTFAQGPLDRTVGVGTITLQTSDVSTPTFMLPGIENVRDVASLIDETRRQERRRRGVYVESI